MKKLFFALSLCFVVMITSVSCAALKVTDPADPSFDVKQFRFEDYNDLIKFRHVIEYMFPVGTSEETIRQTLVNYGSATELQKNENNLSVVIYRKEEEGGGMYPCTFAVQAKYDAYKRLKENILAEYACDGP